MENRKYKVYCWTNKVNGKKYIGMTCQTMNKRAGSHMHGYSKTPYFWNAIQKYGEQNFECKILVYGLTLKEAEQKERNYIRRYRTRNREYGYNIDKGGTLNQTESTLAKQRKKTTAALRASPKAIAYRKTLAGRMTAWRKDPKNKGIVSAGLKRMWQDPEIRERRLAHLKQLWKDPERKKVLLEKRKKTGKQCGMYKPVRIYCKETNTIYEDMITASKSLGVCISNTKNRQMKKGHATFVIGARKGMHWTITVLPEEHMDQNTQLE